MLKVRKHRQLIKADVNLPCPNTVVPRAKKTLVMQNFVG